MRPRADRPRVAARSALVLVALLSSVSVGCGSDSEADAAGPAGTATLPLSLGTGRSTFRPLGIDDPLLMERGHQGLQHVLVGLRVEGLAQGRYLVDVALVREADDALLSEPSRVRLPFAAETGTQAAAVLGYRLVVPAPNEADGERARLTARVEDGERFGLAEQTIQVAWAPDGWDPDAD